MLFKKLLHMFNFYNFSIYSGSMKELIENIQRMIVKKQKGYITVTGSHGIKESFLNKNMFEAHKDASYIVPDGMPLVWLMKLSGHKKAERIYGPDLMVELCTVSQREKYSIFLYGSTKQILSKLKENLLKKFPKLTIVGTYSPPFRTLTDIEKKDVVQIINKAAPNIVCVGLSTPKQELWMHEFRSTLHANILVGVGAAFDFIAGTKKQAPVWMRSSGLEWLFRLSHEPGRLFWRYAVSNTVFIGMCVWYFKRYVIAATFLFILLCSLLFHTPSWPAYVSYGGIFGRIQTYGKYLIYGTSYTKLYILNSKNSSDVKTVDLNIGNVDPQIIYKNSVIAVAGDSVWRIDINTGKELWRYSTENHYDVEKAQYAHGFVLSAIKDGSLVALRVRDGKQIWQFKTKQPEALSSIESSGRLFHFGEFIVVGNTVYVASQDKTLYAIRLNDGKEIWKNTIGNLITVGPDYYGSSLFIMTKNGDSIALSRKDGHVIWKKHEDTRGTCGDVTQSLWVWSNPFSVYIASIVEHFRDWIPLSLVSYFEIHENGVVVRRSGNTGNVIWKSEVLGIGNNCPARRFSRLVITNQNGFIYALSSLSGKVLWTRNTFGKIFQTPVVVSRFAGMLPNWLQMFIPEKYIFGDERGTVSSLNGIDGKTRWQYEVGSPVYAQPAVSGDMMYVAASDGVLFAVNSYTGTPVLSSRDKKFSITNSVQKIGNDEVVEFSISSPGNFENPWREVEVEAYFTHESGKEIRVRGFYFDTNTWKVRINPPRKGRWNWSLHWMPYGMRFIKNGVFVAQTESSHSYIRVADTYGKRLTLDGEHIFNGLGLGEVLVDFSGDGTYTNDWAMGNSAPYEASSSAGVVLQTRSDVINTLQDYIRVYGPKGAGFNMFRWSLLNASGGLWRDLGYPMVYSIHDGKIGDDLVQSFRGNAIHVWLTLFGFGVPFQGSFSPTEKYILKSYVDYVVARYGSYVDIWELANEAMLSPDLIKFLVDSLHYEDFSQKPISMSFETPNDPFVDIISPHWYESEDLRESDIKMSDHIRVFEKYDKPVVFGEQGFKVINYDDTTALRMRVKAWTAFFEEGILMFWNQSDKKGVVPDLFPNANIYLGEQERSYTKHLQKFTNDFSLTSRRTGFVTNRYDVRGYGLYSDSQMAGYFFHYADWKSPVQMRTTLPLSFAVNIVWTDPSTGEVLGKDYCSAGVCSIWSPIFKTDIAFKAEKVK
jgi:N-acetylglucosaminyldiphosphoundecaprenol N-acetyl-beta-D-mannosaminyltransferase